MKTKILGITLALLTFYSCNNNPKNQLEQQVIQDETPEVLTESTDIELSSFSKRYNIDIISKLYREAMDKNEKLELLNDKINEISSDKNDHLADYRKFIETNNKYWNTANNYIDRIQDSTLKNSTLKIFKDLETNYQTEMSVYGQKLAEINEKTISLNDQLILMKLIITEPMINNYQLNEKPDIKSLERVITEYDKLIKETEEYTKNR